jgi:hypothetical protein
MMRCAMAATKPTERQTYIGLAAAWNGLARGMDAADGTEEEVPPVRRARARFPRAQGLPAPVDRRARTKRHLKRYRGSAD